MPLTEKGEKILNSMEETYGSEKKAKSVLYASKNAGKISGIDAEGQMGEPGEKEMASTISKQVFGTPKDQLGGLLEGMGSAAASYAGKSAITTGGKEAATSAASSLPGFSGSTGGSVGGTVNTMINPYRSASTQSQASENEIMGRPANAGPMGTVPSSSPSPSTAAPSASTPPPSTSESSTSPTLSDRVVGRLSDYARAAGARKMADVEGPKGVIKPIGSDLPEEKSITTTSAGGPSGTPDNEMVIPGTLPEEKKITQSKAGSPDKVGRRQTAADRPSDRQVGTLRDYAAAAGARRRG